MYFPSQKPGLGRYSSYGAAGRRFQAWVDFGTSVGGWTVDTVTFLGMSTAMLVVGLLASYLPARRASNVDPIESLRRE